MKDFSINIAEDGGTIQVGDKTYRVTLITPTEQELKPVEGKWYRFVKETTFGFTPNKWYVSTGAGNPLYALKDDFGTSNGFGSEKTNAESFDLSTPLDIDPETLVGKTLELNSLEKFTVKEIEEGNYAGVGNDGEDEFYSVTYITNGVSIGNIKVLDPEPTLTVPENVEFVNWLGDPSLKYNDLILTSEGDGFVLSSDSEGFEKCKFLKLIPCKLEEVKNGEWVVNEERKHKSFHYRLKTEKGWVSFDGSDEYPFMLEQELSDMVNWLKVVRE